MSEYKYTEVETGTMSFAQKLSNGQEIVHITDDINTNWWAYLVDAGCSKGVHTKDDLPDTAEFLGEWSVDYPSEDDIDDDSDTDYDTAIEDALFDTAAEMMTLFGAEQERFISETGKGRSDY
ncbi:MAG: hypothetical protein FWH42_01435 [Dehalococcoidia bacterium]|nr:hypothetical protein [Dehalococcoidia bacterium]